MSWMSATEWLGENNTLIWASDGKEIFQARYQESDICETPEERLFFKLGAKLWLPVIYIWEGKEEPKFLPDDILSVIRNFSLAELLSNRFPELDRRTIHLFYSKMMAKIPRVRNLGAVMEEAL